MTLQRRAASVWHEMGVLWRPPEQREALPTKRSWSFYGT